ncbi:hypothetical protein LZ009_22080 [Ramlibacter sp. XY19]|uniref:hypothetical protein n=1 Tax=Ramlibacter paludis TaxID=2908000 RepID=UPI0023DA1C9C|nr:hypothetical protein [Ramlibacter paludis]MCG2595475.1 hypothetical protein [Ramlibacter paludis]
MPDDPTPHGREVMHQPPERAKIPEREPEQPRADDKKQEDQSRQGGGHTDFVQTPD